VFTIERIGEASLLPDEEQRLVRESVRDTRELVAYWLSDDDSAERRIVLAPLQPNAAPGAKVSSFGTFSEGFQSVRVVGGAGETVELHVVDRLDIV
jgi:hypothetical protein